MSNTIDDTTLLACKDYEQQLRSLPIVAEIFSRLKAELPAELCYHDFSHSEDVFKEVILLTVVDGRPAREVELLAIAAAYHDAGFLQRRESNEAVGAAMAVEALSAAGGYTQSEIDLVRSMIEDTRLISKDGKVFTLPSSEQSKYLLDADLSNLGRLDFWESNKRLQKELGIDERAFLAFTIDLFEGHSWFTAAARQLRGPQREKNFQDLLKSVK